MKIIFFISFTLLVSCVGTVVEPEMVDCSSTYNTPSTEVIKQEDHNQVIGREIINLKEGIKLAEKKDIRKYEVNYFTGSKKFIKRYESISCRIKECKEGYIQISEVLDDERIKNKLRLKGVKKKYSDMFESICIKKPSYCEKISLNNDKPLRVIPLSKKSSGHVISYLKDFITYERKLEMPECHVVCEEGLSIDSTNPKYPVCIESEIDCLNFELPEDALFGIREWNSETNRYGECIPTECNYNKLIKDNYCVTEEQFCDQGYSIKDIDTNPQCVLNIKTCSEQELLELDNANGAIKTWDNQLNEYSQCTIDSCNEGYELENGICEKIVSCPNGFSIADPESSTPSCVRTVVECRESELPEGASGGNKNWDEQLNSYGECTITSCLEGYFYEDNSCFRNLLSGD